MDKAIWAISDIYHIYYTLSITSPSPGEYRVFITNYDVLGHSREDGEFRFLKDGEIDLRCALSTLVCGGKLYSIIKRPGNKAMLTALFQPEEQSLEEFIKTMPPDDLFDLDDDFKKTFRRHKIPSKDWGHLLTMLSKTGKAIWYNEDQSEYKYIWFFEIDADGKPSHYKVHPAIEE